MGTTVFALDFTAAFSESTLSEFLSRLDMTETRIDDWDRRLAFRIVGEDGGVRLYARQPAEANAPVTRWVLSGTAISKQDCASVEKLYPECVAAIQSAGGNIDFEKSIKPPGITSTYPTGLAQPGT